MTTQIMRLILASMVLWGLAGPVGAVARTKDSGKSGLNSGKKPTAVVGITGNMWAYTLAKTAAGGSSAETQQDFSGGLSIFGEAYVIPYLTIGGTFDVTMLGPKGHGDAGDLIPTVSLDLMVRGLYPFGTRKQFEPYLRFAFGYTAFLPTPNFRKDLAPYELERFTNHGWNVKILPGFAYRTTSGVAFLVEMGWAGMGYNGSYEDSNGDSFDGRIMYHAFTFNFGIEYIF